METSLIDFKEKLDAAIGRFLWRQWTSLGVLGTASNDDRWVIDPEALLLFTLEAARSDPRLFDEVLDWLLVNGTGLDAQRIGNLLRQDPDVPRGLVGAAASLLATKDRSLKWRRLAAVGEATHFSGPPEPLFLMGLPGAMPEIARPDPHFQRAGFLRNEFMPRGLSQTVPISSPACLRFKLRPLFGIGIRSEVLAYLLTHESGHAREIARAIGFSFPGVQRILPEMSASGVVHVRPRGRLKLYWLEPDRWASFLDSRTNPSHPLTAWRDWAALYRGLAKVLRFLRRPGLGSMTPYLQASELRQMFSGAWSDLESAGIAAQGWLQETRNVEAEAPCVMESLGEWVSKKL